MIVELRYGDLLLRVQSENEKLEELLLSGEKLNFWNISKYSSKEIKTGEIWNYIHLKNPILILRENKVYLKSFWAQYICRNGGVDKHEFINFQYIAWGLKRLYEKGLVRIEIYFNMKSLQINWKKFEGDFKSDREMIKHYKEVYKTVVHGCNVFVRIPEDNIKICCVCSKEPILLFYEN